jgi:hypothetical protein
MSKKAKVVLLLQGIIFANWFLSKMVNTLMQESVEDIQKVHANLVFIEPDCLLDEALDGTRDSLKSWNRS